jgi:ferritin-like metal-binding protein YciE
LKLELSARSNAVKLETLKELLIEEMRDLYSAESQILKALPKMVKAASEPELRNAFAEHLEQTKKHVERLETVFEGLGKKPKRKTCRAMEGIIEEGEEMMKQDAEPSVRDAALIAAAQRVEHYEIAGYGTVIAYAKLLQDGAVELLQQTLNEEKETDQKLTELAERLVNLEAAAL